MRNQRRETNLSVSVGLRFSAKVVKLGTLKGASTIIPACSGLVWPNATGAGATGASATELTLGILPNPQRLPRLEPSRLLPSQPSTLSLVLWRSRRLPAIINHSYTVTLTTVN